MSDGPDAVESIKHSPPAFWLGILPMRVLAAISCFVLFMMMALTFIDVTGRYLFNSPLPALAEVISFMMSGLVFCVLPLVCYREEHVTIDLLDNLIPRGLKRPQGTFVNIVSAGAVFFIAWQLWERAMSHLRFEEATDELYMDIWPFSMGMAILCFLAGIAQLAAAVGYLTGARDDPATAAGRAT